MLVGQYDISTEVTLPGVIGEQTADRVRTVPVLESELGMAWRPTDCFRVSAGWVFQAWFNLGTRAARSTASGYPSRRSTQPLAAPTTPTSCPSTGSFRAEIGY